MKAPSSIWLPVQEAEIDKEYTGYKTEAAPNIIHFCTVIYKGNGTVWLWGDEARTDSDVAFLSRPLTYQEEREWNKKQFSLDNPTTIVNLHGLYHDMYNTGDAYHEMWNAWIGIDWYEMNNNLNDNDIILVGIAPAPYPWNVGGECVAVVAETTDGTERFWSHAGKDWIEDMREQMQEVYNEINSNH